MNFLSILLDSTNHTLESYQNKYGATTHPATFNNNTATNEVSIDTLDKASRSNAGKPDFSWMTPDTMLLIGKVAEFGRKKYPDIDGNLNWKAGFSYMSIFNSLMRHLMYWSMGQENDVESGLPHLAHAMWNLNTLFHQTLNSKYSKFDNRQHKQAL